MLFGSISDLFDLAQGSAVVLGESVGTVLGTGTGSAVGLLGSVLEALYTASGAA